MYRQTLLSKASAPLRSSLTSSAPRRAFSITIRLMAEGDTGAPRSMGGQPDAFQKREKANEDYTIRMREREKLIELQKKLRVQQDHLKKLSDHIDELTKEQGGEQN